MTNYKQLVIRYSTYDHSSGCIKNNKQLVIRMTKNKQLSRPYNMRPREHEFQLHEKQNSIHERNFLIRIFYLS